MERENRYNKMLNFLNFLQEIGFNFNPKDIKYYFKDDCIDIIIDLNYFYLYDNNIYRWFYDTKLLNTSENINEFKYNITRIFKTKFEHNNEA